MTIIILNRFQSNKEIETFRKTLKDEELDYIRMGIIKDKTVDFLVENGWCRT